MHDDEEKKKKKALEERTKRKKVPRNETFCFCVLFLCGRGALKMLT